MVVWPKGVKHSEETKQKNREWHLGKKNSGLSRWMKENNPMKLLEVAEKSGKSRRGKKNHALTERNKTSPPAKGKTRSWLGEMNRKRAGEIHSSHRSEVREKIRESMKGNHNSSRTEFKKGEHYKENNPNWKGGISKEPYGFDFDKNLKEQIRKRDNYQCQECGKFQKDLGRKLDVHHIDYNKKHNDLSNLISLCVGCNSKANFDRVDWMEYYKEKLGIERLTM